MSQWSNCSPRGPVISRPRSFGWPLQLQRVCDTAGTKAGKSQAGGAACKERGGVGGGAHRGWCREEGRGDRERLWVSAWCLKEWICRCGELFKGGEVTAVINRPANSLKVQN